ncbi:phage minor tail protein L [Ensifer sp. ENS10]|uniref:phage minor tail protein L n=1 Tax=Ensifer sp. ENS10 TaxID=2769286 RepID=UPI001781B8DD|nr:phage minor tail protein L [Ensifer sp. ENS10]MBD9511638.1 phage minor tail protein L [Ensifer sp. ENS10]
MSLQSEAQSLAPSGVISLFTIDSSSVGGPIMHFVMGTDNDGPVVFNQVEYQPIDVQFEGLETSGAGALPTPKIRISNVDGLAQALVSTYGELLGCTLYRVRTYTRFLDGQPEADPESFYGPDIFRFERKTSENGVFIEWELSASIDQEGKQLPGRTVIRNTCLWRYRYFNRSTANFDYSKAQCPYTGSQSYDINDQPVADPALDVPSRRLSCCRTRFGEKNPLPFGGFPGVQRVSS